jgi:hypothetical protein
MVYVSSNKEYISAKKKDGTPKKELKFRFFDFRYFKKKDYIDLTNGVYLVLMYE